MKRFADSFDLFSRCLHACKLNRVTLVTVLHKPLTVNRAWKGKRYKTDLYNQYERDLLFLLPKLTVPSGPLKIILEFGMSSSLSDWDNCIKTTQDILAKKYGFNDKMIVEGHVRKVKVDKGSEYIKFDLVSAGKPDLALNLK